jgi:hypothetical protein
MVALNGTSVNGEHVNGMGPDPGVSTKLGSATFALWSQPQPSEFEIERARLESEIAAADERAATANARAAARESQLRTLLQAETDASDRAMADMELSYEAQIAAIRDEAQAEIDRIAAGRHQRPADGVAIVIGSPIGVDDVH